jgi:hypothetical protein
VFQNELLRRMPEAKIGQERGGWRKMHSIMLNFYYSPNTNRMIKSGRTYEQCLYPAWVRSEISIEFYSDKLGDLGRDGRMLQGRSDLEI